MSDLLSADLCVIGAGSGGLTAAAGAAMMGARTVLIEKAAMGGDCLNTGCVPSKALLAAAKIAHTHKNASGFGVEYAAPEIDFGKVHGHVMHAISQIEPHDSQERFEGLGVTVLRGAARFCGPRDVAVGDQRIRARRFVIATGSQPAIPPIPGLDTVSYLTNETLFGLTERPDHLAIIGGGPIGVEMAQAFARLGSRVTVLESDRMLAREDPELVGPVLDSLAADGVDMRAPVRIENVTADPGGVTLAITGKAARTQITATHLLVATGRRAVVDGLGLDAAGVTTEDGLISVDRRLRTSNRRIFAIGDCTGAPRFTHIAGYEAGIVLRNAMFRLPARAGYANLVRVTYTDPEIAHAGLTESEARAQYRTGIQVFEDTFRDNDRAICEDERTGSIKLVARKGRALGVTIVHRRAGELIQPWCVALKGNLKLSIIAGTILPYPTLGELSKKVAGSYYTDKLFSERMKNIVRLLQRL